METESRGISLSALQASDQADLEILWPEGTKGTGWIITLAGPGHPKAVALSESYGRESLRKAARIEAATVNGRKFKPDEGDVESTRRENVRSIVARMIDWRGLKDDNGDDVPFSDEKGMEVFLDPKLGWAFTQVVEYLADDRSFTKRSATS